VGVGRTDGRRAVQVSRLVHDNGAAGSAPSAQSGLAQKP
jgi:hypothetical protein